jgi:hypothetical protein
MAVSTRLSKKSGRLVMGDSIGNGFTTSAYILASLIDLSTFETRSARFCAPGRLW